MLKKHPVLLLIIILFWACTNKPQVVDNPLWSSTNPFTIPTKTRVQKFLKENLVANYSFEEGKTFPIDTTSKFWLLGWKKIGDNVNWVNTNWDSIYSANEVSDGIHSIKIIRPQANETVIIGDGIESDFIKVIPGNYELSFDIRLENIKPYQSRLGTKLHDAVDIKIEFFDKAKNSIPGNMFSHVLNKEIDYSFKSYPFANYWEIDTMQWGRIRGRSFEPPIMEGIIPNNAQYVKLFFGLKGTGTMWVDNVDFRYSENNLSLLERVNIIKDSIRSPYDLLVPAPKYIEPIDTIHLYNKNKRNVTWVVLTPEKPSKELRIGIQKLTQKLRKLKSDSLNPNIEVITKLNKQVQSAASIIISVGNSELHNRYIELLPYTEITKKPEGYFIYTTKELPNIFFLGGNTNRGVNYAISSFTQLINDTSQCIYNARIIDYPTFSSRGVVVNNPESIQHYQLDSNLQQLYFDKFNHLVFDNENAVLTTGSNLIDVQEHYFNTDLSYCFENSVLVNPFLELPLNMDANCYDISTPPFNYQPLKKYVNQKVDNLIISFGSSNNSLLENCIKTNLKNWDVLKTITNHTKYIEESQTYLNNYQHKLKVKYIPAGLDEDAYFESKGAMNVYFKHILPLLEEKDQFIWAGKNAYCPVIDYADYYRFEKYFSVYPEIIYSDIQTEALINGKNDNNHFFAGNKRLYSLFSPCELDYLTMNNAYQGNNEINFNLDLQSPINILRLSTYADFCWSPETYQPTFSIWKVMVKEFGEVTAYQVIEFNDLFVNLLELINTPITAANVTKLKKSGNQLVLELEKKYQQLDDSRKIDHALLLDIKIKYHDIAHIFKNKINSAEKQYLSIMDSSNSIQIN